MKRNRGARVRKSGIVLVLYESLFSAGMLIALSLLSAIIISSLKNPTASIEIFSLITLLVCAAISGFSTSRYNGSIVSSIISSFIFVALMFVISLITSKGSVSGGVFMNNLCYIMVASLFAVLGKRRDTKRHRR